MKILQIDFSLQVILDGDGTPDLVAPFLEDASYGGSIRSEPNGLSMGCI